MLLSFGRIGRPAVIASAVFNLGTAQVTVVFLRRELVEEILVSYPVIE
jgi:hypothetical protein